MKDISELGPEIERLREKNGFSKKELADLSGMDSGRIGDYERGAIVPTLSTLERIAAVIGIKVSKWERQIQEYQSMRHKSRLSVEKPKKKLPKSNSIGAVSKRARDAGMTYGDYVAKMGGR